MKKRIVLIVATVTILFVGTGFKSNFFEIAKQIEIFTTLFKELNMNYVDETNPAELMDTAIKSMLDDLDPYTRFLNEQDVEEYKIRNNGEYSGIGAVVRSYNDKLLIVEPYKGYPADLAGLKAGDEIIKIGDIMIADFKDDASELLKGAVKSKIDITYKRMGKTNTTSLTREEIEVDAVPYFGKVNDKTGYIVLSKFNRKASKQTKKALQELMSDGAERIILDLRGNPGGLLSEAINVTNLFVPKGQLIVTTKSKVKKFNQQYRTRNEPVDTNVPLVVLVDGRSASASEIVSGALQDLDRAVIVGARSFGKGLVQRPLKLTYGTQLKVTISRYYTPSGRCIQALDYWNRDENGNAVRTEASNFNAFKTRNGRTVYDGGGVFPDVEIASLKESKLTKSLLENNVVFDYATKYYYDNTINNLSDFSFKSSDYNNFKQFVTNSGFSYETKTEKALKQIMASDESDEFGPSVKADYQKLLTDIENSKAEALNTYKEELLSNLRKEIIKRYFYREGLFDYYLKNDEAITVSSKLLGDKNKYEKLLR
ncbi:PDZ domain-containing protein [Leptobacterium flavescens]|uniref:PDZ domain-containing protein n=1 Tax=Leptobacterium flavescens TaxID=472055 RepID=A0A6P0UR44_9FLAO|nr:S41 family peptidase [Leptobacterium flavescens]NER14229.1 PDZ domain-containing protein [Leptobacterium flavescens]